jgi:predicted O-linked N-acetylglucosamine transferase (SPINDLY family)
MQSPAQLLLVQSRFDEALAAFEADLKLSPGDVGALFGRVAASLLTAIGLPALITGNLEDYEKLALTLARDPARLAGLKQKLEEGRLTTALFDTTSFTRNLEAAYEKMREEFLKKNSSP